MRKIIFCLFLFMFFCQFSLLPMMTDLSVNLVLALLMVVGIYYDFFENIGWIILAGLLLDYYTWLPWSINIIGTIILVSLLDILSQKIFSDRRNLVMAGLVFIIAKVFYDFCLWLLFQIFQRYGLVHHNQQYVWLWKSQTYWIELVVFLIGCLMILRIIDRLDRAIGKRRQELRVSTS